MNSQAEQALLFAQREHIHQLHRAFSEEHGPRFLLEQDDFGRHVLRFSFGSYAHPKHVATIAEHSDMCQYRLKLFEQPPCFRLMLVRTYFDPTHLDPFNRMRNSSVSFRWDSAVQHGAPCFAFSVSAAAENKDEFSPIIDLVLRTQEALHTVLDSLCQCLMTLSIDGVSRLVEFLRCVRLEPKVK